MTKKFSYKIFDYGSDKLLAIADSDLLDKTFSGDIELTMSKSFYHDDFCDEKKVLELVEGATIVNAMGEKTVSLLVKNGFVRKENVLKPCGIPHVQIVKMA